MTRYARRFRRIASSLSPYLLRGEGSETFLSASDVLEDLTGRSERFLDYYGDEGIRYALEQYGLLRKIEKLGFTHVDLQTNVRDGRHTLVLEGSYRDRETKVRLAELVVRRERLVFSEHPELPTIENPLEVIVIDWLLLRNPYGRFTRDRMRLPGQDAPGLGIGAEVLEMLRNAVVRLHLDGLVTTADHFHNASLYALELAFLEPQAAGRLAALERHLFANEGLSLAEASWAVEWGLVREGDGETFVWRGEPQAWARNGYLRDRIEASAYRRIRDRVAEETTFALDRSSFRARWHAEKDTLFGTGPERP